MNLTKKWLVAAVSLVLMLVLLLVLHNVYAGGGPIISLNSPVSFPVDI